MLLLLLTNDFLFTAVVSVEPTYSYYEKVSEELEKIVHEVKEETETLSDGEKRLLYAAFKNRTVCVKSLLMWQI